MTDFANEIARKQTSENMEKLKWEFGEKIDVKLIPGMANREWIETHPVPVYDQLHRLGWSISYFSRRVNVNERTLRRWIEEGKGTGLNPCIAYLDQCCRLMGV